MKKANIVVVGLGEIGVVHAYVVAGIENAELYGVCDLSAARGKEVARTYGGKYFKTVAAMCADPEVDGAIVCVGDEQHFSVCAEIAKAKKGVFVEKPITFTSAEGLELKRICAEEDVLFGVAHTTEYIHLNNIARSQIEAGAIGEISHVAIKHIVDWDCGRDVSPRAKLMYYIGVHDVYSIQRVTGLQITKVFAKSVDKMLKGYNDAILAVFTLENGVIGTLEVGWDLSPARGMDILGFSIYGDQGTIIKDYDRMNEGLKFFGADIPVPLDVGVLYESHGKFHGSVPDEDRNFAAALMDRSIAIESDTDISIYSVKVIEAIYKSIESGKEETV
ncbi:MAG: Gfo/Idh/MocA family oxidoreductase [Clostridiales Family XIII bacterium]|nr:Gfo/Idh/MocA family oxidoreductase [Clostridiales Family XIII bacterium]